MESIEFHTKIKNGVIKVPPKYRKKFKDTVRVILVAEGKEVHPANLIEELMAHPLKVKPFRALSREEAHARK